MEGAFRMDIYEPARTTPCLGEYDVIVCGGGIAGISASLASARAGAKTLLIEREYLLGGLATAGLVTLYLPLCDGFGRQVSFGLAEELLRLSVRRGCDTASQPSSSWLRSGRAHGDERFSVQFNPHIFAIDAEQLLLDSGVTLLFGSSVCGVRTENGRITHIIVENKSGRGAYAANTVVDSTGDADIVRLSGEKTALFGQGNILAGWYYQLRGGEYELRIVGACDAPDGDETLEHPRPLIDRRFSGLDAAELTEQAILGRRAALNDFLSFGALTPSHAMATLPSIPQIRMTRRLDGISCMDDSDMHISFDDSVGLFSDWRKRGPVYELRFSAMHGSVVNNLICAGRNLSNTDAMWDITRVIPVCAVSGEAAGAAAALFGDFAAADIPSLQRRLRSNGVLLHEDDASVRP